MRPALARSSLVAVVAVVLTAGACGGSGGGSSPSPVVTTPTSTSSPVALVFKLNGVNGATATGTVTVTTQPGSLTVELKITGLQPTSSHVSHIHVGSCQSNGGIKFALNQVVADGQGDTDIKTTLNAIYPPVGEKWYVVVHAGPDLQGSNSAYLLCGNLFN